ncbi:MAG: hypothetical protein F6J90_10190 [Moorea sp. SIOASIH]|uniref:hypothetical protein n=1 Tax=Moorena sp. SIOASIH TaxID=2607817 RepID=UPI0013B93602|nr:hypothetical protein [Moorena sp. SIOASIH]NEO36672.1 hypothetical protein [Moorena sp. SIOASIH]NEO96148.1 hypothetical protein [Moorena sp. SIO3G5]
MAQSYLREELLLSNRLSKAQQQTALLIVLSNSNLSFSQDLLPKLKNLLQNPYLFTVPKFRSCLFV